MAGIMQSDTSILKLNQAIHDALGKYVFLDAQTGVSIIFAMPIDESVTSSTLSVFLYAIHEDLQMRTAQTRVSTYDSTTKSATIAPGWVNVCCNYIITYWEPVATNSESGNPGNAPDSTSIKVMNQVINALVNSREIDGMPGAYARVIPPKAELNSLGNFWQSLGNKPRLSLNLSVTVPLMLTDKNETAAGIQTTAVELSQAPFAGKV